jgi:hypothetical protein
MTKFVNIFAIPTSSQIEESLKKTSKTARKINKNFSEEEKQLVTPKQTRKALKQVKKNTSKQTKKEPAEVYLVVDLASVNDPKVKEFTKICVNNYKNRFVEYCRKYRLDPKKSIFRETGFGSDSHHFIDNLKLNPSQVYNDIIQVASYMSIARPHEFAMQFANNIAILNENDQFFVAQKELNKFCDTVHSLASGRRCMNLYVRLFALAMVWGYRTLNDLKNFYSGLNKNSKLSQELKDEIAREGGAGFTVGTALAQSGQCKKICKFLGLLNFKKGSNNTPIEVFDRALPLFKIIAGLDK